MAETTATKKKVSKKKQNAVTRSTPTFTNSGILVHDNDVLEGVDDNQVFRRREYEETSSMRGFFDSFAKKNKDDEDAQLKKLNEQVRKQRESLLVVENTLRDHVYDMATSATPDNIQESMMNIMANRRVRECAFSGTGTQFRIGVFTDEMWVVDSRTDRKHRVGRFMITFANGGIQSINLYNLDYRVSGFDPGPCHAPHSLAGANPCLGTSATPLSSLFQCGDVPGLVVLLIQFLESVNLDDSAGSCVMNWPYLDEGELKVVSKANIKPPTELPYFAKIAEKYQRFNGLTQEGWESWKNNLKLASYRKQKKVAVRNDTYPI